MLHQSLSHAYENKEAGYFSGARHDIIDDIAINLPSSSETSALEIGCGTGATLELAKLKANIKHTVGVELNPQSAEAARERVDQVILGNIEDLELPFQPESFDVVIMSEVLEHLIDPWAVLKRLFPLVKTGGFLYASSPNIAHMEVLRMLIRNRWGYKQSGRFDWTHLRWFTPRTYREMVESAGFKVVWNRAIVPMTKKQMAVNLVTLGRFRHLFTSQIFVKATRTP